MQSRTTALIITIKTLINVLIVMINAVVR